MKRHLVTFSIEVYRDTLEEVKSNAEYIREYTEEWMGDTGEQGDGYSTKIVSIDGTPCPPTEEELEEEAEDNARMARVAQKRDLGDHLRFDMVGATAAIARRA